VIRGQKKVVVERHEFGYSRTDNTDGRVRPLGAPQGFSIRDIRAIRGAPKVLHFRIFLPRQTKFSEGIGTRQK